MFRPHVEQTHIMTLCTTFRESSAFENLAFLHYLHHLRFSRFIIYLSALESSWASLRLYMITHIPIIAHFTRGSTSRLFVLSFSMTYQLPLIQRFLPQIRVLGLYGFTAESPPNNLSAPGVDPRNVPLVAPLKANRGGPFITGGGHARAFSIPPTLTMTS